MSKHIKVQYAVNADKIYKILAKETCQVKDIIELIQEKEEDPEYKYIFYEGAQLIETENFYDFYDRTVVYIATKEPKVPNELVDLTITTTKVQGEEDEAKTVIGEDDVEDFIISDSSSSDDDEDEKVDIQERKRFHNIPPPPFDLEPEPNPKPKPKVKKEEYTIYTTLTVKSMTKGHKIDGIDKNMELNDVKNVILNWIKKERAFENIIEDKNDVEVHLFLPTGIVFKSGTINEWFYCLDYITVRILYVVVTRKLEGSEKTIIENVCNCKSDEMKKLLSPLCKTTEEGYTQIASLLGFFYYGGSLAENLLRNLATITGFAPMITSIYNIMCQNKIDGLQIISITAALQTLISQSVVEADLQKSFSYTNLLLSYINNIEIKNLPLPNFFIYNQKKKPFF